MSNVYDADGLLPARAFRTLTGRPYGKLLSLEGGGKGSSPPAPDYAGAAQATAAGNLETARAAAAANRVDTYTPYGSWQYSHTGTDPDNGWSVTQTLSPAEQAKLTQTNNLSTGLLNISGKGLGYVDQALSSGGKLDEGKLAQSPIQGQSVQDAVMSRLAPQIDRDRESLRTRLANQGLMEGSEAYKNAMLTQGQKENDLYTSAALQGIQTGLTARQQGIQEQYAAQDRPLNIVNALRTGNQVNLPQFQNVPQQATTQGADMLQAAMAQGNYDAQNNAASAAQTSGLMGSAATVAAAYFL